MPPDSSAVHLRTLAVIPARGGSRGIPGKNIAIVAGKPLLAWTIEAAKAARSIDRLVVSSDSDEILRVAAANGARPLRRPAELATDAAPSEPVVLHALDALAGSGYEPNVVVLLQPTSPLRTAADIDAALALLAPDTDAVISVYDPPHSPYKCFRETSDGYLRGLVSDDAPFRRRQDLPRALMPNGAIYGIRVEAFRRSGRLLSDRTRAYMMTPASSVDVDTPEDLARAAALLTAHSV